VEVALSRPARGEVHVVRAGLAVLDQLRTVDSERLVKRLGRLSTATATEVLDTLQEMFAQ
jgi:mRNA interferase MazF